MGFAAVVMIVAVIGLLAIDRDPDMIQGQVEVSEYRVSSKVPGRILELRVKEGDYVKAGDTLAILDAPEVRAKMEQAQSAGRSRVPSLSCSRRKPVSRSQRNPTTVCSVFSTRV